MDWTAEQNAIFEQGLTTPGNLIITARAGAAKTTSATELAKRFPPTTRGLFLAFNKAIATEGKARMPVNFRCMTVHGCGMNAWRNFIRKPLKVDKDKTYNLFNTIAGELPPKESREIWEHFGELRKLVSLAKTAGYIPGKLPPAYKPLTTAEDFYAYYADVEVTELEREVVDEVIKRSWRMTVEGILDFDDMVLAPAVAGVSFDHYDVIMVDEAQDLARINHVLLRKLTAPGTRLIAVGDPCQPDGTLITIVKAKANSWHGPKLQQVPIENVREGDIVLGYNGNGAFMFDRRVEGITRRHYSGNLVSVTMENNASRYTPNHICFASFKPLEDKHVLYLMRKGSAYRIGRARFGYAQGCGPVVRARSEGADAIWLLAADSEINISLLEAWAQAHFGLPDLTFVSPGSNIGGYADQTYLNTFWGMMAQTDMTARALNCLAHFGRVHDFPFWEEGQTQVSARRPGVVRACNLMSGCLMLPYTNSGAGDWRPIEVGLEPYEGQVTSFTISDNQLYVADNIVTHNCQAIYGFRGADESSMATLKKLFSMDELFLTTSFRCSKAVVQNARWRAPDMNAPEWAIEGAVKTLDVWSPEDVPDGAAIICRNNAPLFSLAIQLIRAGRYPELKGRDIIKGLVTKMKKLGKESLTRAEALRGLDAWHATEKLRQRDKRMLTDQYECMKLFILETETLGQAIAYIKALGSKAGRIYLMTGHGSKGLEYEHVFILDKHLIDTKYGQDNNVLYVMETRAKNTLTYITSEGYMENANTQTTRG